MQTVKSIAPKNPLKRYAKITFWLTVLTALVYGWYVEDKKLYHKVWFERTMSACDFNPNHSCSNPPEWVAQIYKVLPHLKGNGYCRDELFGAELKACQKSAFEYYQRGADNYMFPNPNSLDVPLNVLIKTWQNLGLPTDEKIAAFARKYDDLPMPPESI